MARRIRPATPDGGAHLEQVMLCLKVARHHAKLAECPRVLKKVRSALASAEGAKRHLVARQAASTEAAATRP